MEDARDLTVLVAGAYRRLQLRRVDVARQLETANSLYKKLLSNGLSGGGADRR
jgi:hypothetical protein